MGGGKLVAAPIQGTGAQNQGLVSFINLSQEERVTVYIALSKWLFTQKIATYFRVCDWELRKESNKWIPESLFNYDLLDKFHINYDVHPAWGIELKDKTEETLWSSLDYKSCRYMINKASKLGLYVKCIDKSEDISIFVDIHFQQIRDVCKRHGNSVKRYQKKKKILALCNSLFPNNVLMLEVIGVDNSGDEKVMATSIFGITKREAIYWTSASNTQYLKYSPNELMVWEAIRFLKKKDVEFINLGGMNHYKKKFGSIITYLPRITIKKKYAFNIYDLKRYLHRISTSIKNKIN